MKSLILSVSTCFGIGKIPIAPGTFGSIPGLLLFFTILQFQNETLFITSAILCAAASVYPCGVAERLLNEKDPSQVVLDEIVAVPICYIGWILVLVSKHNKFPSISQLFENSNSLILIGIFITFRLLDALKPFPINYVQRLPGGWGIVADDLVAAIMTNLIYFILLSLFIH